MPDHSVTPAPAIQTPFPEPPDPGHVREVAPGVLWVRLALPFLLNHVNVYLIEDEGGWAVFDTGLGNDETRAAWEAVFAGALHGQVLTRVVCSHFHPDHVGLVGWLTQRFTAPLSMPRSEFLMTRVLEDRVMAPDPVFYTERGLEVNAGGRVAGDGHGYLKLVTGLPTRFHRLVAGETLRIGRPGFHRIYGWGACAGAGDAALRGGRAVPRGGPGAAADLAEYLGILDGAGCRSPGASTWHPWRGWRGIFRAMCWCCRGMACRLPDCMRGWPSWRTITRRAAR